MLPTAGFFTRISCPFHVHGFCERPFCHYKHGAELLAYSRQSPVGGEGQYNQFMQFACLYLENDFCFLELEKINKDIETFKYEVEKEQRLLSACQLLQEDCTGTCSSNVFILDNGLKDLQPNGSAECQGPTCDEQKRQNLKRTRENCSEGQGGARRNVDSDDDGVLIIDIPPLEEHKKRPRSIKLKSATKIPLESSEVIASVPLVSELSTTQKQHDSDVSTSVMKSGELNCADSAVNQGNCSKSNIFEDITQCLEKLRRETQKITSLPESELIPADKGCCASECSGGVSLLWPDKIPAVTNTVIPLSSETVIQSRIPAYSEKNHCSQQKSLATPVTSEVLNEDHYSIASLLRPKPEEQQDSQRAFTETQWLPVQSKTVAQLNSAGVADHQMNSQLAATNVQQIKKLISADCHGGDQPIHNQPAACIGVCQPLQRPSTSFQQSASGDLEQNATQSKKMPENYNNAFKTCLSSEEEDYSDMDMSDSDPMEECYRIFMEANEADPARAIPNDDIPTQAITVEKFETEKKTVPVSGPKKRVAHISKHELEQKATVMAANVKGGQAFIATTVGQKNLENAIPSSSQTPVQTSKYSRSKNSCVNILPVGAAIQWANVQFIIPEGAIALPLSSVLTPPSSSSASFPVSVPQYPTVVPAKPIASKRRPKARPEASTKVPHDLRQRYVNLFAEEFLKTSFTVQDAFEKALAEEKTIYDRSINKLKYLSVAVNVLKRLKNQCISTTKTNTETTFLGSRGHVSLNLLLAQANDAGVVAIYNQLKDYILSEALLKENNYAFAHPEIPGRAVQYGSTRKAGTDPLKKICCRCGATYSVSLTGTYTRKEECNYHYGKVVENKVPGGVETRYSCCEGAIGTPGCQVFKLHVNDAVSLDSFVRSTPRPSLDNGCPGVFALDCEMCYTTKGLELARVTVVNPKLQVIYDSFVKPDNEVVDYNTRFTGISEEDLSQANSTICDVQAALLSFISAGTILIGHNLQNDLCALKLVHSTVVDTAVVFPHYLGLPHKRTLHSLVEDYLRRIVQSADGHDSGEDAKACMELMLWKVKEDSKVKRL
ncbi:hypothetical protein GN956_G2223 [Arapaima gigas]